MQTENSHLRESINLLKEEKEQEIQDKERLLNEKDEELQREIANSHKKQEEFKLQMDECISDLSMQIEQLRQDLESKQQELSKKHSLVRIVSR